MDGASSGFAARGAILAAAALDSGAAKALLADLVDASHSR